MENEDLQQVIEQFADEVIKSIHENMDKEENGKLGNSNLANSITYEINGTNIKFYADYYWPYAQKGRGPGGVPNNFTAILAEWVSRRNISVDDTRRFVNNVKWKTIREGSYLYRHPGEQRDFLDGILDDNVESLEKNLIIQVKNQYKKDIL